MKTHTTFEKALVSVFLLFIHFEWAPAQSMRADDLSAEENAAEWNSRVQDDLMEHVSGHGVLSGPKVGNPRDTLVHWNMSGEFVPVEGRPEIAALRLVEIDPTRRAEAQQAAYDRIAALGMLLVDEIDLVRQATDAIQRGDQPTARRLQEKIYHKFDPEGARDPLLNSFRAILSDEEFKSVRALVDEYWETWINWELRDLADPTVAAKTQVQERLEHSLYVPELVQAYNLSLRPYRNRLESIYALTEATPDQRGSIRDLIIEFVRETRLAPTEEERRDVARRIYELLDDEQRLRIFEQALWQP